ADAHDLIAALQSRYGRGAALPHLTDHRFDDLRSDHSQHRIQRGSKDQIHGGPREQHRDAMPYGSAGERAMQFRRLDVALSLIEQLDVAAQRYRSHAVLGAVGVATHPHQQRLAEADSEAQNLEAEFLGHPVMAEFVDGDQYADCHQKGGDENQYLHAKAPALSIAATASRRAAASASNTSSRALTGDESRRYNTLSMTVAMPVKFKRRSR